MTTPLVARNHRLVVDDASFKISIFSISSGFRLDKEAPGTPSTTIKGDVLSTLYSNHESEYYIPSWFTIRTLNLHTWQKPPLHSSYCIRSYHSYQILSRNRSYSTCQNPISLPNHNLPQQLHPTAQYLLFRTILKERLEPIFNS